MAADFRSPAFPAFPVTRRSAVASVGSDDPAERARSFDVLVRAYWKPVYKHVRLKWNRPCADAGDLTQGFFGRAFEKRWLADYTPEKARFRTYLKACLDRYVMEALRDEKRQKRGGEAVRLSLDFDFAEEELTRSGGANANTVDAVFDAEWTRSLFASAVEALESLCAEQGKELYARVFRSYVLDADGEGEGARPSYAALAAELGIAVTDVTNYLAWTRREFRRLVLDALRDITATEEEWRSEARALLGVDP
jgi:RNA polymerase sigma factor (sigma-70 family)